MVQLQLPGHIRKWHKDFQETERIHRVDESILKTKSAWREANEDVVQDPLERGHRIMDEMRRLLNNYFDRSIEQIKVTNQVLPILSRQVYGDLYLQYEKEIVAYNDFPNTNLNLIITAGRRMGKSWVISMICGVALCCIPGIDVTVFSTSSRASGKSVGMAGNIMRVLKDVFKLPDEVFVMNNDEHIFLKFGEHDIRKLNAYPGSRDT